MLLNNTTYLNRIKNTVKELIRNDFSLISLFFHTKKFYIDDSKFNKLYNIIKYDKVLVAKLMESAGPLLQRGKEKTAGLKIALGIKGIQKTRELLKNAFQPPHYNEVKEMELYKLICHHSAGTAIFARLLAPHYELPSEEMYMLGLLHDIGKLALYAFMPDDYEYTIRKTRENFITIREAEKEHFKVDHCEVGSMILRAWNFPKIYLDIAGHHHGINSTIDPVLYKKLLCIQASNVLCNHCKIGEIRNIRTMRSELFDKKTKAMLKGVKIPILMVQAMRELKEYQIIFGM